MDNSRKSDKANGQGDLGIKPACISVQGHVFWSGVGGSFRQKFKKAAHELNNVLQIIQGNAELLLRDACQAEQDADYLLNINHAVGRAKYLLQELRFFDEQVEFVGKEHDLPGVAAQQQGRVGQIDPGNGASQELCPEAEASTARLSQVLMHKTVMVVDDEQILRNILQQALEGFGCTVLTAASAEQALELWLFSEGQIQLIILDLRMPGMGGEKCLQKLKEMGCAADIIVASGSASWEMSKHPERYGARAFISKPYTLRELFQALEELS